MHFITVFHALLGDCDGDGDCLSGLKCGKDNCPNEVTSSFDATDDCCYDPKLTSKSIS